MLLIKIEGQTSRENWGISNYITYLKGPALNRRDGRPLGLSDSQWRWRIRFTINWLLRRFACLFIAGSLWFCFERLWIFCLIIWILLGRTFRIIIFAVAVVVAFVYSTCTCFLCRQVSVVGHRRYRAFNRHRRAHLSFSGWFPCFLLIDLALIRK